MIRCEKCLTVHADEIRRCHACGASLLGTSRVERRAVTASDHRQRAMFRAMLVGGILCLAMKAMLLLVFQIGGSVGFLALLDSALFGVALGWLIWWRGYERVGGAVLGVLLSAVWIVVVYALHAQVPSLGGLLLSSLLMGTIPGWLIGMAVGIERLG